jgi:hypothetical protein
LSKLNSLRGNTPNQGAAVFSSNVDTPIASIFARMQGQATTTTSNNNRKYTPSVWRVGKGETKRTVILDTEFTFGMREHSRQDATGKWTTERCIADYDSCPVCGLPNNKPHDVVVLTVLDLTPWEKDGKSFEYTKRVMKLKRGDYDKMKVIASMQGLRGVVLDMTRGHEQKESANGQPTFVMKLTEEDLIESFGSPEKKYEKSGFVKPANADLIVFDYKSIYTPPTRDELAIKLGMSPRPGSKAELQQEEAVPWEEETIQVIDLAEDLPDFPDVD